MAVQRARSGRRRGLRADHRAEYRAAAIVRRHRRPPVHRAAGKVSFDTVGAQGTLTLLVQDYAREIFDGLQAAGRRVFHVLLDADDAVLRSRIVASGVAVAWRLEHLPRYRNNRAWMTASADLVVGVGALSPAEAASQIVTQ